MLKSFKHSLQFKIPHELYNRVKIASYVKNITIARFIREELSEEIVAPNHSINMNFFRVLERKNKTPGANGKPYQISRVRMSTQVKALIKSYAAEKSIYLIQLTNYALNEKLNREGF